MIDNNTVNVSKMTDEQVRALLDGTLSWDDAAALAPGPAVPRFEQAVADFCGAACGVAVNSAPRVGQQRAVL